MSWAISLIISGYTIIVIAYISVFTLDRFMKLGHDGAVLAIGILSLVFLVSEGLIFFGVIGGTYSLLRHPATRTVRKYVLVALGGIGILTLVTYQGFNGW